MLATKRLTKKNETTCMSAMVTTFTRAGASTARNGAFSLASRQDWPMLPKNARAHPTQEDTHEYKNSASHP